jgi:hypothetical protein
LIAANVPLAAARATGKEQHPAGIKAAKVGLVTDP